MTEMNPDADSATKKIVPPMHDAYHKARKLFIFFSLLLLSNELTGVLGVNVTGIDFFGIQIKADTLKDPSVNILLYSILWGYSVVRYAIEWSQVDPDRRKGRASRWDLWVTVSIAFTAVIIWSTQIITGIQVIKKPLEFLLPFFVGLTIPLIFNFWKRSTLDEFDEKLKKRYNIIFKVLRIATPVLLLVYLILFITNISLIAILSFVGAFIIGMFKNALDEMPPFSPSSTPTPGDPSDSSDSSISPDTTQTTDKNNKSEARSTKSKTNSKSEEPKQKKAPDRKTS